MVRDVRTGNRSVSRQQFIGAVIAAACWTGRSAMKYPASATRVSGTAGAVINNTSRPGGDRVKSDTDMIG